MFNPDIDMGNGKILPGEKVSELTKFIINKFADENLTYDESIEILNRAINSIGEYAEVKKAEP